MKIQGRLIVILAVLGLLAALVPLATAGAVTGTVTLSGGEKGQFFSDRTGYNIVTIDVKDADLTPARIGTARLVSSASPLNLNSYIVAGEKDKTDSFDSGTTNGPCAENEVEPTPTSGNGFDSTVGWTSATAMGYHSGCPDTGKAELVTIANGDGSITDITDGQAVAADFPATTAKFGYRYTLTEVARDSQANGKPGVGLIDAKDIGSVEVNGSKVVTSRVTTNTAAVPTEDPYYIYEADLDGGTGADQTPGAGITRITVGGVTPNDTTGSVKITYKYSEFGFGADSGKTLLTDVGTSVKFGGTQKLYKLLPSGTIVSSATQPTGTEDTNWEEVDLNGDDEPDDSYVSVTNPVSIATIDTTAATITPNAPVSAQVVVTFAYHVKDMKKELVTVSSASQASKKLDAVETVADSDTFQVKVAIFSQADLGKIEDAKGDNANITIADLNDAHKLNVPIGVSDTLGGDDELDARVKAAAHALGICNNDSCADDTTDTDDKDTEELVSTLQARLIAGEHGDTLGVVYADASPAANVSKSAKVDMEAPVVTLISPTDKLATNAQAATFEAEVVDTDAGVDDVKIDILTSSGINLAGTAPTRSPITDGFRVTRASGTAIPEGMHKWAVTVEDKVGNTPAEDVKYAVPSGCDEDDDVDCEGTKANEAPRGAAPHDATDIANVGNPFEFTVDTRAPELRSALTGVVLKNPGVKSGDDKETENSKRNNQWVRAIFDLGAGSAPLDAATVDTNDFRVDGSQPLDVKVNVVEHEKGEVKVGAAVYLQVGAMDTDARPKVELTGEVKDKAGNIRTAGSVAAAVDGLPPMITVTPSTDLAQKDVTITVTSSERLKLNPTVTTLMSTAAMPKPTADTVVADGAEQTVSIQPGDLKTWTSKVAPSASGKYYVLVMAEDQVGNPTTEGTGDKDTDHVSFQIDGKEPKVAFKSASGKDLAATKAADKPEEGAVWIVMEFDEDEYEGDSHRKVDVRSIKLMEKDAEEAITEDVGQVFGSEEDCADHAHTGDGDAATNKCAQRTLAVDLMPGMYNIAVTGVDDAGNEVSKNTDFEVVARQPYKFDLRPGQNFISIPGMPMGETGMLDTIFSDEAITAVSTYDSGKALEGMSPWLRSTKGPESGMFSGDITMIEPGKGYFVTSSASVEVEVKLESAGQLPPTIPVRQGFNAIGYWSSAGYAEDDLPTMDNYLNSIGWTVAYSYNPTPGVGWEVIRKGQTDDEGNSPKIAAGKGYLVYALYDSVLTP